MTFELNPSARISIKRDEEPPSFLIQAPIKGASLSCVRVSAENLPGAHAFLCSTLIDGQKDVKIGEQDAAELRQIGLFAYADVMPQPVAYQFPMRDSESAGTLLSGSGVNTAGSRNSHLTEMRIPVEWREQALRFEPHHHGSVWAPIQVATAVELIGRSETEQPSAWQPQTVLDGEAVHTQFQLEGFAMLENLLPSEHVREMGRYFQALAEQGFLACNSERGTRRFTAINHPVARFWHHQLNERVSQLAGRRTKPSYSYVSLYIEGGSLFWHTDIPPCEYTITVLLDYAPLDSDDRSPWALKLKGRDGTIHLMHQRVGEALILKGRELSHGRDVLPDGHRSASLLFHFVDEDYDGVMA